MKRAEIEKRRKLISEYIQANGSLSTDDACRMFHVSDETIRKDFLFLEKLKIVDKYYGGARLHKSDITKPYTQRQDEHYFAKASIADRAMELIPEGGQLIIGLDMGTTISMLAGLLANRSHNLIITNSNGCIQRLTNSDNNLYVLGGEYNASSRCFEGEAAYAALNKLSLDVVFLGTGGILNKGGISTASFSDVRLKREYILHSRKRVVLTDSSKFQYTALVEVAPWSDIDILITDRGAPRDMIEQLREVVDIIIV